MRNAYRIVRFLIVSLLSLTVGIPILLYILLSMGPVHRQLRNVACSELGNLLGAKVDIGTLEVLPFSRLELSDVSVSLPGDTLLRVDALNAGVSLSNLLLHGRLVITDVELMGPDLRVWRADPAAPLNVAPVLERLKGDGTKKETTFSLAVHTVVIRGGSASYNVRSVPESDGFNPAHLHIRDLRADITAPRVGSNRVTVNLKRLNFTERSGLTLKDLSASIDYRPDTLQVSGLAIRLPGSYLAFADTEVHLAKGERLIADIDLLSGSSLSPRDFTAFAPALESVPGPVELSARAELFSDSLSLHALNIEVPGHLEVSAAARASTAAASAPRLSLGVNGNDIATVAGAFHPLPSATAALLSSLGKITFSGNAAWRRPKDVELSGVLTCDAADVEIDAALESGRLKGVADVRHADLGLLLPGKELGNAILAADFDLSKTDGSANVAIDAVGWRGHTFRDVSVELAFKGKAYQGSVAVNDSLLAADISGSADLTPGNFDVSLSALVRHLDLYGLKLWNKYEGYSLSADIFADFEGEEMLRPVGMMQISDFNFRNAQREGLTLAPMMLSADLDAERQFITLSSDFFDARAEGSINLAALPAASRNLLASALPQYFSPLPADTVSPNNFELHATVKETSPLFAFASLPVKPLYPILLNGLLDERANSASVSLSAPYLQKGNKLIHGTWLTATLGENSSLAARTTMPSKKGDMTLNIAGRLADGLGNLSADWKVDCDADYSGQLALSVRPLEQGADIRILPGKMVFNNAAWQVEPTFVGVRNGAAVVNNLNITRPGQEATISGVVSRDPADRLSVRLDNIDLDYIFATLQLGPAITFGGMATGTVHGSGLLSGEPVLQTDDLFVRNFSYCECVMGNANIKSRWNNETRGIEIHANIPGRVADGSTVVDGVIFPLSEELEFTFNANHTPVGFLRPLMSTFASNVEGTASGSCHLFGDFKHVDLEGDMLAENFALTVGFTGVTYFAGDSIHIRPGRIEIPGITLRDASGHTARFAGNLRHKYFKDCSFDFRVTNANRLLVYDMPQTDDVPWFGSVRGNGSVTIAGVPGYVKISANMSTAADSEFSFSLSDRESAAEYNFLTFRDATPATVNDSVPPAPGSPELNKIMLARLAVEQANAQSSNYEFDFQVDITPEARLVLIMDPNAGDKITAYGNGHVGILYGSGNDDLRMYGDYRIERGVYSFSLQDIILKTFNIKEGSEVTFNGDPLNAGLRISAINQLTANLSDLDESFLTDKEVQRTNVPVYAVLNVDGSINSPVISFDLDFPTLSSDVKRKVASIVSTEEMMNRQIIYLLALNKFYTPDYMTANTKGNELVSVASGTISSQLSNILGQLSDKISVAPSVRSDAGDFSDVEFDVALSSTLLNNRLLLNGNFGYRDKALNNNQFIGDFDVEYLLNRSGNWRLKAYNHFNDRNLYVKSALTTQGIGIVFKHDFDNLFQRFRRRQPAAPATNYNKPDRR